MNAPYREPAPGAQTDPAEFARELQTAALDVEAAASGYDPIESFVEALKDAHLRGYARETMQLQRELTHNITCMLAGGRDAMAASHYVATNAQSTTFRWTALKDAAIRFARFDWRPLIVGVKR